MPLKGSPLDGPFHLGELLDHGLANQPDAAAIETLDGPVSWRDLDERSRRLAASYQKLGVQKGDRIASLLENVPNLMLQHLACLRLGAVTVPLNYRYHQPDIDHALEVSGASLLVYANERDAEVKSCKRTGALPLGLFTETAKETGDRSFQTLAAGPLPEAPLSAVDPEAPFVIFFTSGSTGPAKGVTHTVSSMGWLVKSLAEVYRPEPKDLFLVVSSVAYIGGLCWALLYLMNGGRIALAKTRDGHTLLANIRAFQPIGSIMVPSALASLLDEPGLKPEDLTCFAFLGTAGDKASAPLAARAERLLGHPLQELYGMTETGAITAVEPGEYRPGAAGRVAPGCEVSLRDEAGNEVDIGEDGRLWLKSPSVMRGYWNRPDANAEVFQDGWFDTGDVLNADAEGFLYFRGRRKQIIVHDASNIAPQEVEAALEAHPAVAEAGVIGVHDEVHGEDVWAFVTLKDPSAPADPKDIIDHARKLIGYKAPERIIVLDEMPHTAVGKVNRTTLKAMAPDHG